jgi:hypothetical protein
VRTERSALSLWRGRSRAIITQGKEGLGMIDMIARLEPLLLLLAYIALMKWVLPRFGVPT